MNTAVVQSCTTTMNTHVLTFLLLHATIPMSFDEGETRKRVTQPPSPLGVILPNCTRFTIPPFYGWSSEVLLGITILRYRWRKHGGSDVSKASDFHTPQR